MIFYFGTPSIHFYGAIISLPPLLGFSSAKSACHFASTVTVTCDPHSVPRGFPELSFLMHNVKMYSFGYCR